MFSDFQTIYAHEVFGCQYMFFFVWSFLSSTNTEAFSLFVSAVYTLSWWFLDGEYVVNNLLFNLIVSILLDYVKYIYAKMMIHGIISKINWYRFFVNPFFIPFFSVPYHLYHNLVLESGFAPDSNRLFNMSISTLNLSDS